MCLWVFLTWDGLVWAAYIERRENGPYGFPEAFRLRIQLLLLPLALCIYSLRRAGSAFPHIQLTHSYLVALQDSGIPTPVLL